jgi:hypothetical protein
MLMIDYSCRKKASLVRPARYGSARQVRAEQAAEHPVLKLYHRQPNPYCREFANGAKL